MPEIAAVCRAPGVAGATAAAVVPNGVEAAGVLPKAPTLKPVVGGAGVEFPNGALPKPKPVVA